VGPGDHLRGPTPATTCFLDGRRWPSARLSGAAPRPRRSWHPRQPTEHTGHPPQQGEPDRVGAPAPARPGSRARGAVGRGRRGRTRGENVDITERRSWRRRNRRAGAAPGARGQPAAPADETRPARDLPSLGFRGRGHPASAQRGHAAEACPPLERRLLTQPIASAERPATPHGRWPQPAPRPPRARRPRSRRTLGSRPRGRLATRWGAPASAELLRRRQAWASIVRLLSYQAASADKSGERVGLPLVLGVCGTRGRCLSTRVRRSPWPETDSSGRAGYGLAANIEGLAVTR
jgi:hypothetical protein